MQEGVCRAANDHGNSLGLYLHDPDGIEVELTWDRDPAELAPDRGRFSHPERYAIGPPDVPRVTTSMRT